MGGWRCTAGRSNAADADMEQPKALVEVNRCRWVSEKRIGRAGECERRQSDVELLGIQERRRCARLHSATNITQFGLTTDSPETQAIRERRDAATKGTEQREIRAGDSPVRGVTLPSAPLAATVLHAFVLPEPPALSPAALNPCPCLQCILTPSPIPRHPQRTLRRDNPADSRVRCSCVAGSKKNCMSGSRWPFK
jgi:hypothetical protein